MTPDKILRAGILRTSLAAMAMLTLAGCNPMLPPPKPDLGPEQPACEKAADADPNIKALYVQMATAPVPQNFKEGYNTARNKYIRECVRTRSGLPAGGVEPVKK